MRRVVIAILVAATLGLGSVSAKAEYDAAEDEYNDGITHPLRLAGYLAHPIGFAAEWLIGRPFHFVISRPYLDKVFGYKGEDSDVRF
jgi:hypothetical protein